MRYSLFCVVTHCMSAVTSHAAQQPTTVKAPNRNYFPIEPSLSGFYNRDKVSVISSFRRDMDEIGNLQGDYAAQNDDGTYRLSRHVGKD